MNIVSTGNSFISYLRSSLKQWREAFTERKFTVSFIITAIYIVVLGIFISHYLPYINHRQGMQLHNFWFKNVPAINLSKEIFSVLYLALISTIIYGLNKPKLFILVLLCGAIMYSARCLTMYLVPLEPPPGYIILKEPFVSTLVNDNMTIAKDFFFSGHTACLFICYLAVRKQRYMKIWLCIALIAVILMLILQHAHYFIDIAGALIITPICWKVAQFLYPYSYPFEESSKSKSIKSKPVSDSVK